jgi:antitoxin component YwqK of YwqJK toxin-antitoxin module
MMDKNWVGYYKSGQKKYSGEYEDDYKINSWTYYSEKGKIIETRNYKVLNVRSIVIPGEERMIKKSVADGKWIKYSEYDQSIKSEENYVDGNLNGECSYYFPGGIIPNRIINYKDGLLNGKYQNFSRKGAIISELNYKNNQKHGDVKVYNKSGKLISHIVYKDGLKVKDLINKIIFK